MIFVFVWLTSVRMVISGTVHVAANGIISLFLMAGPIPSCVCTTSISMHLSVDIQDVSTWGLLCHFVFMIVFEAFLLFDEVLPELSDLTVIISIFCGWTGLSWADLLLQVMSAEAAPHRAEMG